MWRYKDYSKWYVEDYTKTLSIWFLKKHWYLDADYDWLHTWGITWSVWWREVWSIGFQVHTKRYNKVLTSSHNIEKFSQVRTDREYMLKKFLRVYFTQTDNNTWEKKDFKYDIRLESTKCNYWGVRWWFICPCKQNRCWKLYLQSNWYFASRKTLWLRYYDQNRSKKWREFDSIFPKDIQALKIYETIKYPYRNGKPTRKYKSFLRLSKNHLSYADQEREITRLLMSK